MRAFWFRHHGMRKRVGSFSYLVDILGCGCGLQMRGAAGGRESTSVGGALRRFAVELTAGAGWLLQTCMPNWELDLL